MKDNPKKLSDRILAADTDSVFIACDDIIKKCKPENTHDFLVEFAKTSITPIIEKTFEDISKSSNVFRNTMKMSLEKIASVVIFTAKKRYILKVLSSEGVIYNKPKIVIKGIEAIKSSTPKICREEFRSMFITLMDGTQDEVQQRVIEFQKIFDAHPIEKIAFPKSVSNVLKYMQTGGAVPYIKGTPINSRAAIMYNDKVKKLGLTNELRLIKSGDRLKYVFLKKNNPTKENVIAFIDKLPPQFDLDKWVDRQLLYDKTFVHPLQLILTAIGWKAIPTASLEEFFS